MVFVSCENPYDEVSESKKYTGNPFVSLSSEQAVVNIGINANNNHTIEDGVFKDSLVLSHTLDYDINIVLEVVGEETQGDVETNFSFQDMVTIPAGNNYGEFYVSALTIPNDEISKYKLAIRIKEVDTELVVAGLYGAKKENEERQKRFKTYSFQN